MSKPVLSLSDSTNEVVNHMKRSYFNNINNFTVNYCLGLDEETNLTI